MENLQNLCIAGCILLSLIVLIMWWVLARTNEDNDSLFKDYEREVESNKELSLQIQNLIEINYRAGKLHSDKVLPVLKS